MFLGAAIVILCADWSKDPRKREVYAASAIARRVWRLAPPGAGWTVDSVVQAGEQLREGKRPTLVGFDAPIGLPRSFLQRAGSPTFPDWLRSITGAAVFDPVTDWRHWSVDRPFFIVPAGPGGRSAFEDRMRALGIEPKRTIDERAHANPMFIAGGIPGAVGGSTIDLWQGLKRVQGKVATWPFDGSLENLLNGSGPPVVAEIYPRLAYALAISSTPPRARRPMVVAKTRDDIRGLFLDRLLGSSWIGRAGVKVDDVGIARASEDAFDGLVTAAGLLRCELEQTALSDPRFEDRVCEGGILGSGSVCIDLSQESFGQSLPSAPTTPRVIGTVTATVVPGPALPGARFPCPIPGCTKVFQMSRGGWDAHAGSRRAHPLWHPGVADPEERKRLFRQEYPAFFI